MISRKLLLVGFILANVSALMYQVTWIKELGYIFGTSMLATSTVLSSYMGGLALGSYFGGRIVDRSRNAEKLFGYVLFYIGLYGISTIVIFELLIYPYLFLHKIISSAYLLEISLFCLSFIILIIPTSLIGATFPIFNKIYVKKNKRLGEKFSTVYSGDTAGAAFGAMFSGFFLIPLLGLDNTILIAGLNILIISAIILKEMGK